MKKLLLLICCLLLIIGCGRPSFKKNNQPVRVIKFSDEKQIIKFNLDEGEKHQASIGDTLFIVSYYHLSPEVSVKFKSPLREQFPSRAIWSSRYYFTENNEIFFVYTTPGYQQGHIGIALNAKQEIEKSKQLVQLRGRGVLRKGRRWNLNGEGKIFEPIYDLSDAWAIRYGGFVNDNFLFEIIDKKDASVVEKIQTIAMPPKGYFEGFIVRGVIIKGIAGDKNGVIQYTFTHGSHTPAAPQAPQAPQDHTKGSISL